MNHPLAQAESNSAQPESLLLQQARALVRGEQDRIANAANLAALIFNGMNDVNWAGFYFTQSDQLVLGPFQGQPACVRIPWGQGVCGTAAATGQTQRVRDVHAFEGHIACDAASQSEVVVPLIVEGAVLGVLDVDSPVVDRFSTNDQALLEDLAELYIRSIQAPN
ncbi:MAG: GAF domain-containing protein [Pseudomonadota bacterium]